MHTAEDLVTSLRRRALIPQAAAESSLATQDLVALMSEELQTYVMAELLKLREEFAVAEYMLTTTAGVLSYDLPPRSIKLKNVYLQQGGAFVQLQRVEPKNGIQTMGAGGGGPRAYYLNDEQVSFVSDPGTSVVKFAFYRRPNRLVMTDGCGTITAINSGTRTVTVENAPSSFGGATQLYDLVGANPNFKLLASDAAATVVGATITFVDVLPPGLASGDYVCLAEESPVPMVHVTLHPLLAQRTAVKALEALGDPKVTIAKSLCDDALASAKVLLGNRVEDEPRYVINRNGPGWRRFSWRR